MFAHHGMWMGNTREVLWVRYRAAITSHRASSVAASPGPRLLPQYRRLWANEARKVAAFNDARDHYPFIFGAGRAPAPKHYSSPYLTAPYWGCFFLYPLLLSGMIAFAAESKGTVLNTNRTVPTFFFFSEGLSQLPSSCKGTNCKPVITCFMRSCNHTT